MSDTLETNRIGLDMKPYYEYWGLHIGPKSSQHMQERVLYKVALMIADAAYTTAMNEVREKVEGMRRNAKAMGDDNFEGALNGYDEALSDVLSLLAAKYGVSGV